jgi:adenine-specific DNA-methyltransferase
MAAPLQDNEKDALIARLQNENRSLIQEKSMLGLNYNHKKEDGIEARHLANNDIPVFTKVPELSTVKTDEDIDHLLIEGDNLPALVALLPTYRGKVNVIYIDPPYNTGNNDFVYNDRYVDSEDGFRHSKWLSFMKPRLQLAHEMLSDDGVIFVSIDDHEQAYLKVMMDEIFGESNFVANLVWHNRNPNDGIVSTDTEYILLYSQRKENLVPTYKGGNGSWQGTHIDRNYRNPDNDPRGDWRNAGHTKTREQKPFSYSINILTGDTTNERVNVYPYYYSDLWRYSPSSIRALWKDGRTFWKKSDNKVTAFQVKKFKNEESSRTALQNFIPKSFTNTNDGKRDIEPILGKGVFGYPKPKKLIKFILDTIPAKDSIILDFFAGSGTTGQAVAELNKDDGGHRKCILITNNFEQDGAPNGIARDITSVRMKRVLTGENWADGKKHEPLPGNLIYYRLDWQPMSTSLTNLPGMLPLSTFLGSLSINQDANRPMNVPDNMPTLSKLVHDGHAALLTNENNRHTVLALDTDTSDDFDALDTVKAELEGSNLLEGLDVAMESGFDADTYMDSGVFDHEFTFPVPDIIQIQATVKMLKKDGVISINDDQEDHTHMNNDNNDNNKENR